MKTQKDPFQFVQTEYLLHLKAQTSFMKSFLILKNGKQKTANSDVKSMKEIEEIKL